jgi:hypothetical protein
LLLWTGELLVATGVAGVLLPPLLPTLGFLADLLFLAFVIAGLSLAVPFIGTGFQSALTRGNREVLGVDALFLSVQCVLIAAGIGIARGGLSLSVAAGATAVGLGCLAAYIVLARHTE